MGRPDLVSFHRAKKANVPTLGTRFLVKFPRVGKAIEVKCPTYARGPSLPPSDLTLIDAGSTFATTMKLSGLFVAPIFNLFDAT